MISGETTEADARRAADAIVAAWREVRDASTGVPGPGRQPYERGRQKARRAIRYARGFVHFGTGPPPPGRAAPMRVVVPALLLSCCLLAACNRPNPP